MVLRTSTARSIIAAGLHPSLSLHHVSRGSPLRLADDLMEPFRPYIDLSVARRVKDGQIELDADCKAELAGLLTLDLPGPRGASPMQTCIDRLASSLAQVFTGAAKTLELPGPALDLAISTPSAR
jgi:CRISPR-associated protein Cas1